VKNLIQITLPLIILIVSCRNIAPKPDTSQAINHDNSWCRRYKGTIGNEPVVVILFYCPVGGRIVSGGRYYFSNKSEIIHLSELIPDSANKNTIHTIETPPTYRSYLAEQNDGDNTHDNPYGISDNPYDGNNGPVGPEWTFSVNGNKITGAWYNKDDNQTKAISLTEDYSGAGKMELFSFYDTTETKPGWLKGKAIYSFLSIKPPKGSTDVEKRLLNQALLKLVNYDSLRVSDISDFPGKADKKYLEYFRKEILATTNDSEAISGDYYEYKAILPEYYDHGLLVFSKYWSAYRGGVHGGYGNDHITLDMDNKKELNLADILLMDTARLNKLLDVAARKYFDIPSGGSLGGYLLVDTIPPTENYILSDMGITFCYSPYEIGSFADGELYFFIPFTQLEDMVRKNFRIRMHL
jgi:hypothetical protein